MEIILRTADILVPVKNYPIDSKAHDDALPDGATNGPPGSYEYSLCPKARNVFGESRKLHEKKLDLHYIGLLDCQCGVIVSKQPLIAVSFEKSSNLEACCAKIMCERDNDLNRIVRILNPKLNNFTMREKKVNLPANFYEMELRI